MGYRIIAELAGLITRESTPGKPLHIEDPKWGGYLANVTPAEFEQNFAALLPERIGGREFVTRYRGITDPVTRVGLERNYAVRVPTAHAIYEHHRVNLFAELLEGDVNERSLEALGELMYQSHASYSSCGLGSEQTDLLVQLVREARPAQGLYGAKITGGGSGGTVAVLGRRNAASAVEKLADRYARETGYRPNVFAGSSPGSAEFAYLKLEKA
jgi:L-arabinokinase